MILGFLACQYENSHGLALSRTLTPPPPPRKRIPALPPLEESADPLLLSHLKGLSKHSFKGLDVFYNCRTKTSVSLFQQLFSYSKRTTIDVAADLFGQGGLVSRVPKFVERGDSLVLRQ